MARAPRLDLAGISQHIIQRGNNRDVCFASNEDFVAYAHFLKAAADKYHVAIHAWVFMTNHVHLLVTPNEKGGVSKMMQSLGRQYVRYFNYTYRRTGTLWEGRFKSCLIDTDAYLLQCYRYIELNPVRAGMVRHPSEYKWSSYSINALGKRSELCMPHELYLALGRNDAERQAEYRCLFSHELDVDFIQSLREITQKGLVLGRDDFIEQVEALAQQRARAGVMGRPRKHKSVL